LVEIHKDELMTMWESKEFHKVKPKPKAELFTDMNGND
jgi:hypothetical protein